jgi:hypothetical protein
MLSNSGLVNVMINVMLVIRENLRHLRHPPAAITPRSGA